MITGRIKSGMAIFICACLVLLSLAPYHAIGAGGETRYELISGGVTFGNDAIRTAQDETLFHQQALATMDFENMDISFPGSLDFSPSQGVDLAFPSITQTVDRSVSYSSVGFFTADLPFYPCCNFGAAPVGVGQFGKPSPVTPAAFIGSALMYPEMINQGNLVHGMHYTSTNINNPRLTLPPSLAAGAYGEVAAANATLGTNLSTMNVTSPGLLSDNNSTRDYLIKDNASSNQSQANANNTTTIPVKLSTPVLLSEQKYNLDANSSRINNSTIVERMWRNSHLSHLMDDAYEGDASSPIWIAPQENMSETLQRTDHDRVMRYALKHDAARKIPDEGFLGSLTRRLSGMRFG